ncbi:MAG: NapC/NirT family cytochrome c [Candidatus Hydrothermarchaeales archaeon]
MANGEEGGTEEKSSFLGSGRGKILAIVIVLLVVGGLAGWRFMIWMEEDERCGDLCHNHQEYYDMYQGTSHQQAGVMCKDCHVKPGTTGWIGSQIGNTNNLLKFYIRGGEFKEDFDVIMEGIPTEEWLKKAAPMESCQRGGCHDNNKFISAGTTRSFEFDPSVFTATGEKSLRSPEDEPETPLISEATNEKNTQGILSFHQLHIQAPSPDEVWVTFGFGEASHDTFVMPHYQDCHGNVMQTEDKRIFYTSDDYVGQEEWTLTYESRLAAPGRGAWTGGTLQKIPVDVCLNCHDGENAPGIYANVGGDFPTDLPS